MSANSLLETMTRAGLVDSDLARERLKGQRDLARTQAWTGVGSGLIGALSELGLKGYENSKAADEKTKADGLAAEDRSRKQGAEDLKARNDAEDRAYTLDQRARAREDEDAGRVTADDQRKNTMDAALSKNADDVSHFDDAQKNRDDEMFRALERIRAPDVESGDLPPSDVMTKELEAQSRIRLNDARAKHEARRGTGGPKPVDPAKADAAADKKRHGDEKSVDALRKEFNALPAVKTWNEVKVSQQKMKQAAATNSPAGDLTLIYSFMKMQDPGSTVREGEFAMAAKAGSYGDQLQAAAAKIISGERLTPEQRKDFMTQADNFAAAHKAAYDEQASRYGAIATERGVKLGDVTGGAPAAAAEVPPWRR